MLKRFVFFSSLAVLSSACVKRSPVMPSPLGADETASLQQALLGTCDVISSQKEGGEPRKEEGLSFTFGQEGMAGYNAFGVAVNFTYRVEGRNVLMKGAYEAFRVDDWSGGALKLFVYDVSSTWICKKRG